MEVEELENSIKKSLEAHMPPLRSKPTNGITYEGTKPGMQGKQKVDGYYFASVVPKPKDVRLYFFPIYTHADQFKLSSGLQKCLKGKSCFHIKAKDAEHLEEIESMIRKGIDLYQKDGLI